MGLRENNGIESVGKGNRPLLLSLHRHLRERIAGSLVCQYGLYAQSKENTSCTHSILKYGNLDYKLEWVEVQRRTSCKLEVGTQVVCVLLSLFL
jgi:hypothetical protein